MIDKPYIIGEVSGNHNQDIDIALRLIDIAKEAGVNAVKFQTFKPDSLTLKSNSNDFMLKHGQWSGRNLYELYTETMTPWHWFPKLYEKAKSVNLDFISSPFCLESISFLIKLKVDAIKIASNELSFIDLVTAAAKSQLPVYLSCGIASLNEIKQAVQIFKINDNDKFTLLHCISQYPVEPAMCNIKALQTLKTISPCKLGLSDHSMSDTSAVLATGFGASVFEKHFTEKRDHGGPDAHFSLEPKELKAFVDKVNEAYLCLGENHLGHEIAKNDPNIFTRQYVAASDLKPGELLSNENIIALRLPQSWNGMPASQPLKYGIARIRTSHPKGHVIKSEDVIGE